MRVWLEPTGATRVDLFGVQIRMMAGNLSTGCCIVGGGPAGMMLGFLLARAGVAVTVRARASAGSFVFFLVLRVCGPPLHSAREAPRFPARLPRRHDPSLDARVD